jgi:hypothetical protein
VLIKEVDFLESVIVPDAPEDDSEEARERDAVGRIDTVLVHPDKPNEWCALELQAVSSAGCDPISHSTCRRQPWCFQTSSGKKRT